MACRHGSGRNGAAGGFYVVRDGALIAWVTPEGAGPTTGFNVLGAHTDSPSFKLKPKPTTGKFGWLQAGVEVYGGPLLNSWLDRELQLAGRLVMLDGTQCLTATGPLLRFPQLAIHLDRAVNDGLALDKQQHMNPVFGLGDPAGEDLLALLAERATPAASGSAPVDPAQIGGYDVVIADTQPAAVFGAKGEFFASGRLDNLSATHAGLAALIAHALRPRRAEGGPIAVLAAFDHEEIGSNSRSGACGPLLEDILVRISDGLGASASQRRQALAASFCVSADAGHAVHPNYAERHDPVNRPGPQRRAVAEDQRQPALRHRCARSSLLGAAVRRGGDSVPGVRLQQRDAVRIHHRTADGDAAGHQDRRRGRAAAVHALGTRTLRRRGPVPAGQGDRTVLPDGGVVRAPRCIVTWRRTRRRHRSGKDGRHCRPQSGR